MAVCVLASRMPKANKTYAEHPPKKKEENFLPPQFPHNSPGFSFEIDIITI